MLSRCVSAARRQTPRARGLSYVAQCVVCSTEIRDDARFCPSCGAEQPRAEVAGTDADPLMGKVVAKKFKIEKLLGVGGMGKVYKARQLSLDKAVVVKVLHDHFREDPQLVQRFQREAKAASRLNHPNSIQIIDFGQDDSGVVFMAMEYLQGQDLFALIKKEGPLAPERIARVMIQACSALAEAHEQNVIHRDLKPENIMVEDRRGQKDFVKVLDFGIAKIQDPGEGQQALTQAGMVCGTPEYMSPEQARGLQLDPRSDIYALGVVMYQLALGELPFQADTPIGIVTKHILEKPVPPRQRAPQLNIPEELEQIILKAMEKEPDKRFATTSDLADALEAFVRTRAGFGNVPSTNSGSGRPVAEATQSNPQAQQAGSVATHTAPTPFGAGGVRPVPSQTGDGAVVVAPRGGGARVAALSFVVVAVLGIGAAVLAKAFYKPGDKPVDPPLVVDAGVRAAVADAGFPPVVDAGAVVLGAADAGVVQADAGPERVAVVDAGPVHKPPKDPKVPKPPAGNRVKAVALYKKAVAEFNNSGDGTCSDATLAAFNNAANADPSYADPYKYISQCYAERQKWKLACHAITNYVEIKGADISPSQAAQFKASRCK
jgi:serine/threonine protein kinase